jgi:hypothetical protein
VPITVEEIEIIQLLSLGDQACNLQFCEERGIHRRKFSGSKSWPEGVRSYQVATVTSSGTSADWSYRIKNSEAPFQTERLGVLILRCK